MAEPAPNKPLRPDFALAGQQQRGMQVALQQCCICHPECLKWSSLMLMKWQNLGHSDCHFERSKPGNFQLGSSGQRQTHRTMPFIPSAIGIPSHLSSAAFDPGWLPPRHWQDKCAGQPRSRTPRDQRGLMR
jgi:hypothetical protein